MTAYNVTGRTSMVNGQPEDVSVVLANLDLIAAVINGGLDDSNIAPGAAIAQSKLAITNIGFDPGDTKWSAARNPAAGWLKCDGSAVSRATYAALFEAIMPTLGTFTVTIASPGVFTKTAHGLVIGDKVTFTTTGALPTGLAVNTRYHVVSTPSADTFTVSATEGGAAINTTGSQSGVHSIRVASYGIGDGTTTFNLPDAPERSIVAAGGASGDVQSRAPGQSDGVALASRSQTRTTSTKVADYINYGGGGGVPTFSATDNHAHTVTGLYLTMNLFIKT